jgi:hypothetical protein
MRKRTEEQMREMEEKAKLFDERIKAKREGKSNELLSNPVASNPKIIKEVELKKPMEDMVINNEMLNNLKERDWSSAYDVIPIPSLGKLYHNVKSNLKVSFMTTMDEVILTSPNLLGSGQFLEILIERKLLEQNLNYRDLIVGDRNTIMIWLRATAYGEKYPVTLIDENNEPFESEIDLSTLKLKELKLEVDENGLIKYVTSVRKDVIKHRFLTVGDIEDIEKMLEEDEKNGVPINKRKLYELSRIIVEVNGRRDSISIIEYVSNMLLKDSSDFIKYLEANEPNIDLEVTVGTPGGGSLKTFLPLNINFFWPNIRL